MENLEEPKATTLFEQESVPLQAKLEALLFASPRPLTVNDILEILGEDENLTFKDVKNWIHQISEIHASRPDAGFHLECTDLGQYQFRTKPQVASIVERLFSKRPRPLSRAAQESLAIVAYRQPVSRADIEFIRGTDSGSIIKNLLERDLIRCVGRKDIPGKPMLFGTTEEFLRVYRLAGLGELPSLESFQPKRETMKFATDLPKDAENPAPLFPNTMDDDVEARKAEVSEVEEELEP